MDVRPLVPTAEVIQVIGQIVRNRTKTHDPYLHELPDDPHRPDPRGVLAYLRRRSDLRVVPPWVLRAEAVYAQTLRNRIWWEEKQQDLAWLRTAVDRGVFLSELASAIGLRSREGARARMLRLEALLRFAGPHLDGVRPLKPGERVVPRADVGLVLEERRLAARAEAEAAAAEAGEDVERDWVHLHRDVLAKLARDLVVEADRYGLRRAEDLDDDGERDYIDQLANEAELGHFTPATVARLGLAVGELRTAPAVLALDVPRPVEVHRVLQRADALRTQFAELGKLPIRRAGQTNRPRRFPR